MVTTIGDKCDPHDDANVLASLLSPIVPLPRPPVSPCLWAVQAGHLK